MHWTDSVFVWTLSCSDIKQATNKNMKAIFAGNVTIQWCINNSNLASVCHYVKNVRKPVTAEHTNYLGLRSSNILYYAICRKHYTAQQSNLDGRQDNSWVGMSKTRRDPLTNALCLTLVFRNVISHGIQYKHLAPPKRYPSCTGSVSQKNWTPITFSNNSDSPGSASTNFGTNNCHLVSTLHRENF